MDRRIGVLLVATGRYTRYLPALLQDLKVRFLPQHPRTVFLFSDQRLPAAKLEDDASADATRFSVVHVPTAHAPWPLPTLHRYHHFSAAHALLAHTDALFYLDADTRVVATVGDEVLPDASHDLVGVEHPGFCGRYARSGAIAQQLHKLGLKGFAPRWLTQRKRGSYETRPDSSAYVASHEGALYFMGGFNGGQTPAFLRMARQIRANVDADARRGVVAVWHDESHLNRYFIDHPPKVLSPAYGYPERWQLPYEPRILMLDKDHAAMRAPLTAEVTTAS